MRLWKLVFVIAGLGVTACTTFHEVKAIYPGVGNPNLSPTTVSSLQPTLKWQPISESDGSYDLVIYEGITGEGVYYRLGLTETEHTVAQPLKPATRYYWAVRVRSGGQVSDWSRYSYDAYYGFGFVLARNVPFWFQTPEEVGKSLSPQVR